MISAPIILVGSVAVFSICGGAAFKQFAITREPLWLVAGVIAYNLSNVAWIVLIDQAGLARAAVFSAAGQIICLTVVGMLFGERLGPSHVAAAILAAVAVLAASAANPISPPHPEHQIKQEDTDA